MAGDTFTRLTLAMGRFPSRQDHWLDGSGRFALEVDALILGESREILPQLLARLGRVDMFIHDSDHSYAHMKFEFEQSYPYIRPGGLFLSDDANFNSAFDKYIKTVRPDMARVIRNIGILQKR